MIQRKLKKQFLTKLLAMYNADVCFLLLNTTSTHTMIGTMPNISKANSRHSKLNLQYASDLALQLSWIVDTLPPVYLPGKQTYNATTYL